MRRRKVATYPIVDQEHTKTLDNHQYRHHFRSGDVTWIKIRNDSWWPAQTLSQAVVVVNWKTSHKVLSQFFPNSSDIGHADGLQLLVEVVDAESVGDKPEKNAKDEVLVWMYGTCEYFYVDPLKYISEFESVRKREKISIRESFKKTLEKDISNMKSAGKSKRKVRESEDNGAPEVSNNKKQNHGAREETQEETIYASPGITSGKPEVKKVYTRMEALRQRKAKLDLTREPMEMENAQPDSRKEKIMNQCMSREQNATKLARKRSVKHICEQDGLRRSNRINVKEQKSDRVTSEASPPGSTSGKREKMEKADEIKKAQNGKERHENQKRDGLSHPESIVSDEQIRAMVRDVIFKCRTSKQSVNGKSNTKEEIGNRASEVENTKGEGFGKKEHVHVEKQVNIVSSAETLTGLVRNEGPEIENVKKDSFRKLKIEDVEEQVTEKIGAKTLRKKEVKQCDTEEKERNKATNGTLRTKKLDKENSTTLKAEEIKEQETAKSKLQSRKQGDAGGPAVVEDVDGASERGKVDPKKSNQLDYNGRVTENGSCRTSKDKREEQQETRKREEAKSGACQGKPMNHNDSKQRENNNIKMHQSTETTTPIKHAVTEERGHLSARQIRIMQSLGLIAPPGSPFARKID